VVFMGNVAHCLGSGGILRSENDAHGTIDTTLYNFMRLG